MTAYSEESAKLLYAELNGSGETYEISLRNADEIMKEFRSLKEKIDSATTSVDEKARLTAAKESLEPIAKRSITDAKSNEEKFHQKVAAVAKTEGKPVVEVLKKLATYHKDSTTQRIIRCLQFAQSVDILFVYDVTGSMSPHIKALSSHIRGVIEDLNRLNKYLKPRLGLVGYRDPEDGDKHFDIYPFHESITNFEKKLKSVESQVGGGGDPCEDVIGALQKATDFNWLHQNRLLFLCADAPCHGKDYHDLSEGSDNYFLDGLGVASEPLHKLIDEGVQVIFWKINDTTDKMIRKFNEEASRSPTKRLFPGDRPRHEYISSEDMTGMSGEMLLTSMRRSLCTAISASFSTSTARVKGAKSIKHALKSVGKLAAITEEEIGDISRTSDDVPDPSLPLDVIERAGERRLG
jgi:hypothetical protein